MSVWLTLLLSIGLGLVVGAIGGLLVRLLLRRQDDRYYEQKQRLLLREMEIVRSLDTLAARDNWLPGDE